ncbi:hypothetical protein ACO0QE_004643 [Hanseniaspora vineae]
MSVVTRTTRKSTRLRNQEQEQSPEEGLRDEVLKVKLEGIEKLPGSEAGTSKRHSDTGDSNASTNKKRKTNNKRKTNISRRRQNNGASDEEHEDAENFDNYAGSHVKHSSEFEMIEGLPCSTDLPPDNYQQFFTHPLSIIDSAVLYNALQQSRKTWCHGEMFKKYWSRSRDGSTYHIKLYRDDQDSVSKDSTPNDSQSLSTNNGLSTTNPSNNNGSMHKFTDCTLTAGPHQFKIKLFILKNDELEESWKVKQDEIKREKEQLKEQQKMLKLQEQEAKRLEQEKFKEMREQEKEEKLKLKKLRQEQKEMEKQERVLTKQKQKEERLKKKEEMKALALLKRQEDAARKQRIIEERKRQKEEERIWRREQKIKLAAMYREEFKSKSILKKAKTSKPQSAPNKTNTSNTSPQPRTMYTSPEEQKMIVNLNRMAKADPHLGLLMKKVAAANATPEEINVFKIHIEEAKRMDPPPNWEPVDYNKLNETAALDKNKQDDQNKEQKGEKNEHEKPVATQTEKTHDSTESSVLKNEKNDCETQNDNKSTQVSTETKDDEKMVSGKDKETLNENSQSLETVEDTLDNRSTLDTAGNDDGDKTIADKSTVNAKISNENVTKEDLAVEKKVGFKLNSTSKSEAVGKTEETVHDVRTTAEQGSKPESGSSSNEHVNETSKTDFENTNTGSNAVDSSSEKSNKANFLQTQSADKVPSNDDSTISQRTGATTKVLTSTDAVGELNEADKKTALSKNDTLSSDGNPTIQDNQTKQNIQAMKKELGSNDISQVVKTENATQKEEEPLSLFQQKYAENADLLIEFNEHSSERYLFPKDCFIDYDSENNVYTISWMILHNATEFSKYCGKRKIDYDYKNNQFTLFPLEVLEKGPTPLYSTFTMQLSDVPRKFRPIIMNSCAQNTETVKQEMEAVLKRGQKLSGYNLWYQIDAYDNEDLGEELRSNIQAYERSFKSKRAPIRR